MKNLVKIGVVGTGGWGKNHLRVLKELEVLQCFCDIDEARVKTYRLQYEVQGYLSLNRMLKEERLDAVTVCIPATAHYGAAVEAINAGLDVFVEKPFTASSLQAEELVELAEKKKVMLAAGYIERFNPAVIQLKEILKNGRLGEPLLLQFHRENRWAGGVRDVGIISDTSVHDIDTARWVFKDEPNIVFARTGRVVSNHEDFATIILGFNDQKTAFIASNWVTPKRVRQLIAVCTGGIVTIDFITQEVRLDEASGTSVPRGRWEEPLMLELKSFVESVMSRKPPLVTGADAMKTAKIAEAALASSKTGSPIYLDL